MYKTPLSFSPNTVMHCFVSSIHLWRTSEWCKTYSRIPDTGRPSLHCKVFYRKEQRNTWFPCPLGPCNLQDTSLSLSSPHCLPFIMTGILIVISMKNWWQKHLLWLLYFFLSLPAKLNRPLRGTFTYLQGVALAFNRNLISHREREL